MNRSLAENLRDLNLAVTAEFETFNIPQTPWGPNRSFDVCGPVPQSTVGRGHSYSSEWTDFDLVRVPDRHQLAT